MTHFPSSIWSVCYVCVRMFVCVFVYTDLDIFSDEMTSDKASNRCPVNHFYQSYKFSSFLDAKWFFYKETYISNILLFMVLSSKSYCYKLLRSGPVKALLIRAWRERWSHSQFGTQVNIGYILHHSSQLKSWKLLYSA